MFWSRRFFTFTCITVIAMLICCQLAVNCCFNQQLKKKSNSWFAPNWLASMELFLEGLIVTRPPPQENGKTTIMSVPSKTVTCPSQQHTSLWNTRNHQDTYANEEDKQLQHAGPELGTHTHTYKYMRMCMCMYFDWITNQFFKIEIRGGWVGQNNLEKRSKF